MLFSLLSLLFRPAFILKPLLPSKIHYWDTGAIGKYVVKDPMVLGHESSGTIHSVGSAVTSLKPGDRVALEPGVPCRRCVHCKSGFYNLCADMKFAASPPADGTLTKYYTLPEDFCYKLPEGVSLEEGALVEPTSVAVHIVKQANVKLGDTVVVFGAGPVGLLCAGVARCFGAGKIVVVDIQEGRVEFAKKWVSGGCGGYIPNRDASAEENARNLLMENGLGEARGGGADVVLDASGAEASVQTGIHVLRTGGTYVQGGMGKSEITFPILTMCIKELNVRGSFRYGSGDYKLAVELIADGKLIVRELITGKVGFWEAERAFGDVKSGKGIKTLIEGVL